MQEYEVFFTSFDGEEIAYHYAVVSATSVENVFEVFVKPYGQDVEIKIVTIEQGDSVLWNGEFWVTK